MSAITYDITLEQGASKVFEINFQDAATQLPIDLTGYSGRGQVRLRPSDVSALASFEVTIEDPTSGTIRVKLAPDALNAFRPTGKNYSEKTIACYDIEIYNDIDVIRVVNGKAFISPGVTK
jgi:hypothetical protein